ncbi:MAG: response regulator [Burkholderiales bacterium]|nr:response regulator [Burkholderiales bacterium]
MPERTEAPFRVLVVDDDPDMAAFLEMWLKREGMHTVVAHDGNAALAMVQADPPDLVICDVLMPGPDGFEVCRRLKTNEATALIPVVLVTALDDSQSRVRGIEAGADDFLSKPVHREELIARVKTLRRLHETRKELEARRLAAEVAQKEAIRRTFARYLSPRLVERVLAEAAAGRDVFRDLSERRAVVALFADLRGFTHLSEVVPVAEVVPMLNEFFTILTAAAHDHEGTVFSMAGDSLLVGFNIPVLQPDAAVRALACAEDMIRRFAPLGERWRARFGLATGIGVGIEAGEVVAGSVGAPNFVTYTIIGDAVNVAARLMQNAQPNEILIGPRAMLSLAEVLGHGRALERRRLALKGKAGPVDVVALRVAA